MQARPLPDEGESFGHERHVLCRIWQLLCLCAQIYTLNLHSLLTNDAYHVILGLLSK